MHGCVEVASDGVGVRSDGIEVCMGVEVVSDGAGVRSDGIRVCMGVWRWRVMVWVCGVMVLGCAWGGWRW